MKKILLTFSALALFTAANAQRLVLLEEMTGENCGPCAYWNPQIEGFMDDAGRDKVQIIKYQVPIPSAGPIYNEYKTDAIARRTYYTINSAPSVVFDGAKLWQDGSGNPSAFPGYGPMTSADITTAAGVATPFEIKVEGRWSKNNDSLIAKVDVKATGPYTATGTNLKLRLAYVQTLEFDVAPGSNMETTFENVVRKMYPNATGTTLQATWAANNTQSFEIGGPIPSHLLKQDGGYWVAWVQDDADKKVLQSARSTGNAFPTNVENMDTKELSEVTLFPNPAAAETKVRVTLRNATSVGVNVTDLAGRTVYTVPAQKMAQGTHEFTLATGSLSNGVYNVSVVSDLGTTVQRLSVIK